MKTKPKEVRLLGVMYKVVYFDDIKRFDLGAVGYIDYESRVIGIWEKLNIRDTWQCIIHEALHGISNDFHMDWLEKCHDDDIDRLALLLINFIEENILNGERHNKR